MPIIKSPSLVLWLCEVVEVSRREVFAWIIRYNTHRRHSTCAYLSPADHENAHHRTTLALAA